MNDKFVAPLIGPEKDMEDFRGTADLTSVKRVMEVGQHDIDGYLGRGWVLLAVLKKVRDDSTQEEYPSFIVGHHEPAQI